MRLLSVLLLVAALIIGGAGCALFRGVPVPDAAAREDEEYRVYSSVLQEMAPGVSTILLRGQTISNEPYRFRERDPGRILASEEAQLMAGGVWEDFLRINAGPIPLRQRFTPPLKAMLLGEGEPGGDVQLSWEGTSPGKVKGGVVELSRVGFSRSLDRAVVYAGVRGENRAGGGDLVFLEKDQAGWKVVKKVFVWIA